MLSNILKKTITSGNRAFASALHNKMAEKIEVRQAEVKAFNKEYKDHKIGEITVG